MEILSPAGNFQSLTAAVRSGADAVYLGLKNFSARRNAENFDLDGLREAIKYCRIRGVKVYVALNTMIKESEMPKAVSAAADAYNCGADAFIVTDLGLISVLHRELPEATLHASTQMTVHSPAAIKSLKRLGIKRVVLAREMSREAIKEFCKAAAKENIEVEVFVHGALCMCVSGQCLLSSVLGGRSGNRGLCAGPCRLRFSAAEEDRYDLSLKDLSLVPYIKELESFGVKSVKIEGRMKRPEYVAAATAACRAALDGREDLRLQSALKNVFSRSGFTDGYYTSRLGADMFGIRTKEDVSGAGDAFSYLHSLYKNERQSVPVRFSVSIKAGKSISLTAEDDIGNSVTVTGDIPQSAEKKSTDAAAAESALLKLGGTPYFAEKVTADIDGGLFVSAAELNLLRRKSTELLSEKRAALYRAAKPVYTEKQHVGKTGGQKIYARFADREQIPADISGIDAVILPFRCDFSDLPEGVLKIAELPRYIKDESAVKSRLKELKSQGVRAAYCGNLAAVEISKEAGFGVIAANGLNIANSESYGTLQTLGADEIIMSAEINISDAKVINGGAKKGVFAYGRLPLMVTVNCPVRNVKTCKECEKKSALKDRKGMLFPVRCQEGYCEILNSSPIYLADKKSDLCAFDFLFFYFTDEDKAAVRDVLDGYAAGKNADFAFTRGLYYRNLL